MRWSARVSTCLSVTPPAAAIDVRDRFRGIAGFYAGEPHRRHPLHPQTCCRGHAGVLQLEGDRTKVSHQPYRALTAEFTY